MTKDLERAGVSPTSSSSAPVTAFASTSTPPVRASSSAAVAPRPIASARKLEKLTGKQVQLNILEVKNPDAGRAARCSGHRRAARPARVAFRRAMRKAIQSAHARRRQGHPRPGCSGRLGGAEMTRSEFYREGRVPLHTLRANIDYGFYEATYHLRPHRRQGLDLQGRHHRARVRSPAGRAVPSVAAIATAAVAPVRGGRATEDRCARLRLRRRGRCRPTTATEA